MSRLQSLRLAVDMIDDGLVAALALRRALARRIGTLKRAAGASGRDTQREARIQQRGRRLAQRLGVPGQTVDCVLEMAIEDALRAQADDLLSAEGAAAGATRWLAVLPPPHRLAPLLARMPAALQGALLQPALRATRMAAGDRGWLDPLEGRRLGIAVQDLGLHWTVQVLRGSPCLVAGDAEACVRGSATDLLLLAARLEDADTLFFQRRLVLTGDTELGLTLRNVLDRIEWSSVPLAWRILLNRSARLAASARGAHSSLLNGRQSTAAEAPAGPDLNQGRAAAGA